MPQLLEQPPHSHGQHVLTRGENKRQTFDQFHIHHNESHACEDRCFRIATQRFLRKQSFENPLPLTTATKWKLKTQSHLKASNFSK